jgi:thiol-disulfide isomerase/thioredoxin
MRPGGWLVLVACSGAQAPQVAPRLPAAARLADPDASSFVVADRLRGKVAVLDFWASWCEDCKKTVPQIARLAAAFQPDGLVVVGVNEGEARTDAMRSAGELGITYPIALDPELQFSDALGTTGLPVLLVVDRDGRIVHRARHVDEATLSVIRSLLHP